MEQAREVKQPAGSWWLSEHMQNRAREVKRNMSQNFHALH